MATASASAAQVRYLEESEEGVTPSGNATRYRVTKESLNQSVEGKSSQELRADRQVSDSTLVSGSVGGSLPWELSLKTHDTFIEALLSSTWVVGGTAGVKALADAVFDSTTHTITSAANAIPLMEKGQWFRITTHGTAANNGVYRCSTSVAPTIGSVTVDTAVKDVTTAASAACSLSTSRIKNGLADLRTFSIEKEFSDVSQFFMTKGAAVKSMNISFNTGDTINGDFNFLGRSMTRGTTTMYPSGLASEVAATTTPLINTVNNTVVLLDGVTMGESCAESFSLAIDTGMRERRCLGSGLGLAGVSQGTFDIKGSLSIYFGAASSAAVYDKMIGDLPITFSIYCEDANGDGYAFTVERGKITSSTIEAGGINTDVIMALEFSATIGANGAMLIIDRIGSVA